MLDLPQIRIIDVVDVLLVTLLLWATIVWIRGTRARMAVVGIALLGVVYHLTRQLGLRLSAWLLQGFFAVLVIVVVVVFQDELRRLFQLVALWVLRRGPTVHAEGALDILVRTVLQLAEKRTGALLVLPGREPLDLFLEGGILLEGRLSEPLLLSIFDASSPGHDGAVIVSGDRIHRFAVHLPLSSDQAQLGARGTRHAAALGLSERTDAMVIVVSEERGTVSVARQGALHALARPDELAGKLQEFRDELAPVGQTRRTLLRRLPRTWREGLIAMGLAVGLWLLLTTGSTVIRATRAAPLVVEGLPPGLVLQSVEPKRMNVTLSGRRADLLLVDPAALRVRLDGSLMQEGFHTVPLMLKYAECPTSLRVERIEPQQVSVEIRKQGG